MEKFLQGAFGQVTYELIFFSVQESHYGTYKCHIANSKGYGVHQIRLASKWKLLDYCSAQIQYLIIAELLVLSQLIQIPVKDDTVAENWAKN